MTRKSTPPPACNTGVEKPSTALSLDWIEGTFPQNVTPQFPPNLAKEYHECKPFQGYTEGTKFIDGRVLLTAPSRPDMGTHVIWSGGSLQDTPMPAYGLVHWLARAGFRFTRLDFAIDIRNWGIKPRHATRYIRRKQFSCRARSFRVDFDPVLGGYTQYVGTKSSEIYLRIYDKAAQLGINTDWTRAELVAQGRRANTASKAILRGDDYRALVMGFIRFPTWAKWNEAMAAAPVTIPAEKTISATEKWLLLQAAPALGKLLADAVDREFLNRFLEAAFIREAQIREKRSKGEQQFDNVEISS